ncbi:MAG: hypothetical protein VCC67_00670 [Myxococcota bacterium]
MSSRSKPERWELAVYGLLLAYFAARVVWLALRIHPYVPPDEITHIGRVLAYANSWGVPENGPASFEYGLLDHRPWLYYWGMARTVALNVFPIPDLFFVRLMNGVLGLATAVLAILWVQEWCRSPWARVLFGVLVTNTLMLTGLAGSVSYDNGANLLAAASVLAFTRFRSRRSAEWLLAFVALVLAGCLAKRTFLPLGFLLVVWMLFRERSHLGNLVEHTTAAFRAATASTWALLATVLILGGLALALFGGNLLQYRSLSPAFDQVVGEENAMQNRVFARARILERFRAGEITVGEARRLSRKIRHLGDRRDTIILLKAAQRPASSVSGRIQYVGQWSWRILKSSVGYLGHRRVEKSDDAIYAYTAVFLLAALLLAWRWRPGASHGVPADAAFLAAGYALILMWFVNYPNYQASRFIELGLQGRYIFPVLVPIYGLVAYGIGELAPEKARPWLVAGVAAFYLYGDFPWFLQQIDPERWLMPLR